MSPGPGARGLTLVELLVALVISSAVATGAYAVLFSSQRFYGGQAAVLEVHQGIRAAVQVLAAELRAVNASGGDIVAIAPDSISIRATRRLAFVCSAPDPARGTVVVRDTPNYGFRAVDPARDRALVFREGDPGTAADDAWLDFGIAAAGSAAACEDGAPGSTWALTGPLAGLDSVTVGSPVRVDERAVYRLYADGDGAWWLGVRTWSDGSWAAVSPVAGPLLPVSGLVFRYFDAGGATTGVTARVASIGLELRGLSSADLPAAGGRHGRFRDSIATVIAPRNGRAGG